MCVCVDVSIPACRGWKKTLDSLALDPTWMLGAQHRLSEELDPS